jgi:hypothetical protein
VEAMKAAMLRLGLIRRVLAGKPPTLDD